MDMPTTTQVGISHCLLDLCTHLIERPLLLADTLLLIWTTLVDLYLETQALEA